VLARPEGSAALAARGVCRLDQHPARMRLLLATDVAIPRFAVARLADSRIEAEIPDEVTWARKAGNVPRHADERQAGQPSDAGDRHQPPDLLAREGRGCQWRPAVRKAPAQFARRHVGHPDLGDEVRRAELGEGLRVDLVGLHLGRGDRLRAHQIPRPVPAR
jgi:hypothetical protein